MADRGDTGKASFAAADKAGAWGRHGARPANRGRSGGQRENQEGESSGLRGDDGVREASGVAHESPGVGDEEGVRESSIVVKNTRGSRQGVGGGVELPQGTDTPGVAEVPRGDKTPGLTIAGEGEPRKDRQGQGGDETPPTTRATRAQGAGRDNT